MPTSGLPDISILMPVYNEIGSIAEKLDLVRSRPCPEHPKRSSSSTMARATERALG